MKIESSDNLSTGETRVTATFDSFERMTGSLPDFIFGRIADGIARKYVEDNYVKIAALVDQQAVANMAVAEASNHISKSIDHSTAVNANAAILEATSTKKRRGWL